MFAPFGMGRRVDVERAVQGQARAEGAEAIAAHVEDAAEESSARRSGRLRTSARDETDLVVHLEDEARAAARPGRRAGSKAADERVAEELDLAAEVRGRELGRRLEEETARREEAVVSRVVRERGTQRDRSSGVEEVRERQALEDGDEAGGRAEEGVHLRRRPSRAALSPSRRGGGHGWMSAIAEVKRRRACGGRSPGRRAGCRRARCSTTSRCRGSRARRSGSR